VKPERFLTLAADAVAIVLGGGGMALNLWTFYASSRIDATIMAYCAGLLAARTAMGVWQLRPTQSPGASGTPESPSPSTPSSPPLPSSSSSTPS